MFSMLIRAQRPLMLPTRAAIAWMPKEIPIPPGMRTLLPLVRWGMATTAALVLAVVAASSTTGSHRLAAVAHDDAARTNTPQPQMQPTQAQLAARAEAEVERQKLATSVQMLTADRDRLLGRMASLEHALEDITGSIKRQAAHVDEAAPAAASETAPAEPATEPAPVTVRAPAATMSPVMAAALASLPALTSSSPAAATAPTSTPDLTEPDHLAGNTPATDVDEGKPEFGIDIGGAMSFDGLRALWKSVGSAHAKLLEGMHPIFIARENVRPRGVELRLIAGPVPDALSAAKICATLTAARRFCQPAKFDGQTLSLARPAPEHWPASAASEGKARLPAPRPTKQVP
jgi:hypothetical protein